MSLLNSGRRFARALNLPPVTQAGRFLRAFNRNLAACDWEPHPQYSVFGKQWDRSFYAARRPEFEHKYRCFWAVSRTIKPERIVEIGCASGASADAYLSATPTADYHGFDWYGAGSWWAKVRDEESGELPTPRADLEALFKERGFARYRIHDGNLRALTELPVKSDFVVVDAAHDFENEYADLKLALTAGPRWIFVDDVTGEEGETTRAVNTFLAENASRVEFTANIDYIVGGLVIKLR